MSSDPSSEAAPTDPSSASTDFKKVIGGATVLSRDAVRFHRGSTEHAPEYNPVDQTAAYMLRAVRMEDAWETTVNSARNALLRVEPRGLYLDFFAFLKKASEKDAVHSERYAKLLESVALRGLGVPAEYLRISPPRRGSMFWHVDLDSLAIKDHIDSHIVGKFFLNPIEDLGESWGDVLPLIGASDISQHRSAVPIPARFFKRNVPFVLNNAAGTLWKQVDGISTYENIFNPKPDENLLRWMLIDPSYQDELSPEDYERCIASAMDVGQYKFDLEFLMKSDQPPHVIFRDGSLFPQDAFLDNYVIEGRRGEFTREAIRDLLACLLYAREVGLIYCGVSKSVQLKAYSAVVDWYISQEIDRNWEVGNYTLTDGQAMSILLASPDFIVEGLQQTVATCLIRRSFTTRAGLNTRTRLSDLEQYFTSYENQHQGVSIKPFRSLAELAHVYMFFIGHSKSPQQQLPRYEFFYSDNMAKAEDVAVSIFAALRKCGLMSDHDHSFMADRPVTFLLPTVTQQAHLLSKDVGRYIDSATGQWIMARYKDMLAK